MRRRSRVAEAVQAVATTIDPDDLAAIDEAVPAGRAAGDRRPPAQLSQLDSPSQTRP